MKGDAKLIEALNGLLADELTAVNQYMVHSEMCANWGYGKLHALHEKQAVDEMKHAEKLIGRILFLEGTPVVSKLKKVNIGADVPVQWKNDRASEDDAIRSYNAAIKLAVQVADNATKVILDAILKDEDGHMDMIEEQLDQIDQMGLPQYLSMQVG